MSIKVSGVDVIDDNRKWVGNTISNSLLEYNGSQVINTETSTITLTSSSPQYTQINASVNTVNLPSASLVGYGFKRFVIENNTTNPILISNTSVTIFPSNVLFCSAVSSGWSYLQVQKSFKPDFSDRKSLIFNAADIIAYDIVRMTDTVSLLVFSDGTGSTNYKTAIAIISEGPNLYASAKHVLSSAGAAYDLGLVQLDSTRALAVYSNSGVQYARVITVSGNTVTSGTQLQIGNASPTYNIGICKLNTDRVLVHFPNNGFKIITTSGTEINTISALSTPSLASTSSNHTYTVSLTTTRAMTMYGSEGSIGPYFSLMDNTSGDAVSTPTAGITTNVNMAYYGRGKLLALNSTTCFALYALRDVNDTDKYLLKCNVLIVSGNSIITTTEETIIYTIEAYNGASPPSVSACSIGNKVFITYTDAVNYTHNLIIASVNGATVDLSYEYMMLPGTDGLSVSYPIRAAAAINDNTIIHIANGSIPRAYTLKLKTYTGN